MMLQRLQPISGLVAVLTVAYCGVGNAPIAADAPLSSAAPQTSPALPVTAAEVRPHIESLTDPALKGRGGPERRQAADYIRDRFAEFGVQPVFSGGSYFQRIPAFAQRREPGAPHSPPMGINVAGWVPGRDPALRDELIIISAHYDHLGVRNGVIYPGADDNASGVAMLLETAREIAGMVAKPRRSFVFVGFDLEERLLWGSRWFAAHAPWDLRRVKLVITADMIGRSLGDLNLPTVFVFGGERARALQTVLDDVPVPDGLELARLGSDLIGTRSDYGPFRDRRIPFLFFSTGQHGDYHTPRDRPGLVDCEKVALVSTLILSVALHIANADDPPEWTDAITTDLQEARAIHRITEIVLTADRRGTRRINSRQRLFVSQVHARTGNAIRLGRLTKPERQWLAMSTQLLLLSVF